MQYKLQKHILDLQFSYELPTSEDLELIDETDPVAKLESATLCVTRPNTHVLLELYERKFEVTISELTPKGKIVENKFCLQKKLQRTAFFILDTEDTGLHHKYLTVDVKNTAESSTLENIRTQDGFTFFLKLAACNAIHSKYNTEDVYECVQKSGTIVVNEGLRDGKKALQCALLDSWQFGVVLISPPPILNPKTEGDSFFSQSKQDPFVPVEKDEWRFNPDDTCDLLFTTSDQLIVPTDMEFLHKKMLQKNQPIQNKKLQGVTLSLEGELAHIFVDVQAEGFAIEAMDALCHNITFRKDEGYGILSTIVRKSMETLLNEQYLTITPEQENCSAFSASINVDQAQSVQLKLNTQMLLIAPNPSLLLSCYEIMMEDKEFLACRVILANESQEDGVYDQDVILSGFVPQKPQGLPVSSINLQFPNIHTAGTDYVNQGLGCILRFDKDLARFGVSDNIPSLPKLPLYPDWRLGENPVLKTAYLKLDEPGADIAINVYRFGFTCDVASSTCAGFSFLKDVNGNTCLLNISKEGEITPDYQYEGMRFNQEESRGFMLNVITCGNDHFTLNINGQRILFTSDQPLSFVLHEEERDGGEYFSYDFFAVSDGLFGGSIDQSMEYMIDHDTFAQARGMHLMDKPPMDL